MKLMSLKQYGSMTKAQLVRKIMKALKKLPKRKLVKLCYELEKKRLPTISTTKKNMPRLTAKRRAYVKKKDSDESKRRRLGRRIGYKKPRSPKQLANDKRLGRMAKARAKRMRTSFFARFGDWRDE